MIDGAEIFSYTISQTDGTIIDVIEPQELVFVSVIGSGLTVQFVTSTGNLFDVSLDQ